MPAPFETTTVTVVCCFTVLPAAGSWAITWPAGASESRFSKLGISPASRICGVGGVLLLRRSPTAPGPASAPVEMSRVIGLPRSSSAPGRRDRCRSRGPAFTVPDEPLPSPSAAGPASLSVFSACFSGCPATSGTTTVPSPVDTVIVTVEPLSARDPAVGSCSSTVPGLGVVGHRLDRDLEPGVAAGSPRRSAASCRSRSAPGPPRAG